MKKVLVFICVLLLCGCTNSKIKEEKLKKAMADNNYIIVDVRSELEYDSEHVIGAINIPVDKIDDTIELDKTKTIIVYCQSGSRSNMAYEILTDLGYQVLDIGAYNDISLEKGKEDKNMKINVEINNKVLTATLEDNSSAKELFEKLQDSPITIDMHDYASMEKVGNLGFDLSRNDRQIKVDYGDIILYLGNMITIYYDKNEWNFTKLGHIDNITQEELKSILGSNNVLVKLSIDK